MGRIFIALLVTLLLGFSVLAAELQPNQDVEVREGDLWSPAKFIKKEGRRHQIRYADGTEEWVTPDRIRESSAKPAAGATTAPSAPAGALKEAGPRKPQVGDVLEGLDKITWRACSILEIQGDQYKINWTGWGSNWDEFVSLEKLRWPGDTESLAAQNELPQVFKTGDTVEYKSTWGWEPVTIARKDGEFYLVKPDKWAKDQTRWEWVMQDRLRKKGSTRDGPGTWDMVGASVGRNGIEKALVEAKKSLADRKTKATEAAARAQKSVAETTAKHQAAKVDEQTKKAAADARDAGYSKPDHKAGTTINLQPKLSWSYTPGKPVRLPNTKISLADVKSPGKFFGIDAKCVDRPFANIGYAEDKKTQPRKYWTQIVPLNGAGKPKLVELNNDMAPNDISLDQTKLAAVFMSSDAQQRDRLEVLSINEEKLTRLAAIVPYSGGTYTGKQIVEAMFIDKGDTLLTISGDNHVTIWDWKAGRALFNGEAWHGSQFAYDASRTKLFIVDPGAVVILNLLTGKVEARASLQARGAKDIALSPDERRLFVLVDQEIINFDLQSGKVASRCTLPGKASALVPLSNNLVTVDGFLVVFTARSAALASLDPVGIEMNGVTASGQMLVLQNDSLVCADILNDSVNAGLGGAEAKPPLLARGSTVSVRYELNIDGDLQQKAIADFNAQLEERGLKVAEGQPLTIVFKSTPGQSRPQKFRKSGAFEDIQVNVQSYDNVIAVLVENKPIYANQWSISGGGAFMQGNDVTAAIEKNRRDRLGDLGKTPIPAEIIAPVDVKQLPRIKFSGEKFAWQP